MPGPANAPDDACVSQWNLPHRTGSDNHLLTNPPWMFPEACARVPRHRRVRASRPVSRARRGLTRWLVPGQAPRTALRTGRTRVAIRLALSCRAPAPACSRTDTPGRAIATIRASTSMQIHNRPPYVPPRAPKIVLLAYTYRQSGSAFDGLSGPRPGTFPRADRSVHKRTTHWTTDWNTERNGHRCVSPTAVTRDYPQTAR